MGTLSVNGPLQLDASSTSQFELNDPTAATPTTGTPVADGTGDFVAVSGDLLMNGTIRPIPSPGMAEGAYKIFTYGGNLSNSATLDSSLLTPLGLTVQIDTSVPNEVWLVVKKQPAPQTVSFTSTAPSPAYAGGSYQAAASATSGLPATLSSQTPGICTIDGNGLVTLHAAGTCILAANQAGNASWQAAAQATQSFVVSVKPVPPAPAPQTVSFTSLAPTAAQTGGTYQATASATSGLPAVLTSTTPSVCTVDANGLVTLHAAGTCTLAANQAGNASWLAAAEATQSFSVGNGGTTPVAAKPIPTLHPAALALLSLIAAVLGAGVLRRRA